MTKTYKAYGLNINSTLPLPGPEIVSDRWDVEIKEGKIDRPPFDVEPDEYTYVSEEEMYIHWKNVGTFFIGNGKEIIVDLADDIELSRLGFFLINGAMGAILYQRGYLVLHSSAVSIDGNAVAFSARSGSGKSTIAATMHSRGHTFISDDLIATDVHQSGFPTILPSFPRQKLLPDAAIYLGDTPDQLPRIATGFEKRHRPVDYSFACNPVPLKQLYILGWGDEIEVKKLERQEAVLNILSNSVSAHWSQKSSSNKTRTSDFLKTTALCQKIDIYSLKRPRNLELMPEIAALVEAKAMQ